MSTERITELTITEGVHLVRLHPAGEYVVEHDGRETAPLHHAEVEAIREAVAAGRWFDLFFNFDFPVSAA